MMYYILKVLISAVLIVAVTELSKKSTLFGSVLASLPLTSVFALIWLYLDTKNLDKVMELSLGIFWMVLPSVAFFLTLYFLIRGGLNFAPSMIVSVVAMSLFYTSYIHLLGKFGIEV